MMNTWVKVENTEKPEINAGGGGGHRQRPDQGSRALEAP